MMGAAATCLQNSILPLIELNAGCFATVLQRNSFIVFYCVLFAFFVTMYVGKKYNILIIVLLDGQCWVMNKEFKNYLGIVSQCIIA